MSLSSHQVTYRVIQVSDGLSRGAAVNVLSSVNLTGRQQAVTQVHLAPWQPTHSQHQHHFHVTSCFASSSLLR